MVFWYLGVSLVFVWNVFRSPALDYRLVMVGSVLPLLDVVHGGPWLLHSLVFVVALMGVIMVATRKRRLLRRRLISLPIGLMMGLVVDGSWATKSVFAWPFFGWGFPGGGLPSSSGRSACGWCWTSWDWSAGVVLAGVRLLGPGQPRAVLAHRTPQPSTGGVRRLSC